MDRMVRSLLSGLQELQGAPGAACRLLDGPHEDVATHVEGARGGHQQTARLQEFHPESIEPQIRLNPVLLVLASLDEGGRIEEHGVETGVLFAQGAQHLEGIAVPALDALGQPIACRIVGDPLERRQRAVDTDHLLGTQRRGTQTPSADIAAHIQDAPADAVACESGAVLGLVEEPAGLLAGQGRDEELQVVLDQGQAVLGRTQDDLDTLQSRPSISRTEVSLRSTIALGRSTCSSAARISPCTRSMPAVVICTASRSP